MKNASDSDIPEDVRSFIERRIDTVPHLEALLLMSGDPLRSWTVEEIAARVYVPPEQSKAVLIDLSRHGLVRKARAGYVYDSASSDAPLVSNLELAYRRQLVAVTRFIHSRASPAVREFARAFKFKRD